MLRSPSYRQVMYGGPWPVLLALAVAAVACGPAASPGSGSSGPPGAAPKMDVTSAKYADEWLDPATAAEPPITQAGGIAPEDLTATPKYGGTLRVGSSQNIRMDPHFEISSASGYAHRIYASGLLRWDLKTGTPQPDLADSWTVAKDGLSYDFKIRKGVKFHNLPPVNGREVTIQDIKWSLDRISGLEPSPGKQGIFFARYANVKEFQIIDDATLRMVMKQPDVQILAEVMHDYPVVLPKEAMIDNSFEQAKTLIGTGPFIVEWAESGGRYRFNRNPNYWEKDKAGRQLPYLDSIETAGRTEAVTIQTGFKTRQLDWVKLAYSEASTFFNDPNIRIYTGRGMVNGSIGIYMNTTIPPFNDVRVRRALNLAVDREEVINAANNGPNDVYPLGPIGAWQAWHWSEDKIWSLPGFARGEAKQKEIAEAKRLLAEAGYANGIKNLPFYSEGTAILREVMQSQLAAIGIEVKIIAMADQQLRYATFMRDKPLGYAQIGGGHTPDFAVTQNWTCNSVQNMALLCDEEIERLFREKRRERETAKRKELIDQIQQRLWDLMPIAPMVRNARFETAYSYVKGRRNMWYDSGYSQGFQTAYMWLDK